MKTWSIDPLINKSIFRLTYILKINFKLKMKITSTLGWHMLCLLLLRPVDLCKPVENSDDSALYPKYPLTIEDLRNVVMEGNSSGKPYKEVYSLDPMATRAYGLPLLRKVAVQWNLVSDDPYPGIFSNFYSGWLPYSSTCETGIVEFETLHRKYMQFGFYSVYPPPGEYMIGTTFSSCPEKYLINWYCPEKEIIRNYKLHSSIKRCRRGARMSIYSRSGPNNMPWQLIVKDLCENGSPQMDDKRWTMTYDAPTQCEIDESSRKKRATDGVRHYL